MRYLFTIFALLFLKIHAQQALHYDKPFTECEDKWVAFKENKDSTHSYGFIYIDEAAGLTLNLEGSFIITADNKFIPKKLDSTHVKIRLEPNNVRVALIPAERFNELQIEETPQWLKFYKTDTGSVVRLYRWGFMYNSWDQCSKALTYLEKAWVLDPDYKGLAFELAYSYNCLAQYNKAIPILKEGLTNEKEGCLLYKELCYSLANTDSLEEASKTFQVAKEYCKDKSYIAEMSYNIGYTYYQKKDKLDFLKWAAETKKWVSEGEMYKSTITLEAKAQTW